MRKTTLRNRVAKAIDKGDKWGVGDLLFEFFGPPVRAGRPPKGVEKDYSLADFSEEFGFPYASMMTYRRIAAEFPEDKRCSDLSFAHHAATTLLPDEDERSQLLFDAREGGIVNGKRYCPHSSTWVKTEAERRRKAIDIPDPSPMKNIRTVPSAMPKKKNKYHLAKIIAHLRKTGMDKDYKQNPKPDHVWAQVIELAREFKLPL